MLYPAAVPRTVLMDLLWQGYAERSARLNLRQTLTRLRDALLTPDLLAADNQRVQLTVPAAAFTCDALRFRELVEACRRHDHSAITQCAACQARLQQALELYQGPFLANFPAVDSAPFTAWRLAQENYFAELFAEVRAALHPIVAPIGNLPPPLTSLIGRTVELTDLANKLQHAVYRCLTLTGPGGVGKTRLARALGNQVQAAFADGVWLVELAAVSPPATPTVSHPPLRAARATVVWLQDRIATAIGDALGLKFHANAHPSVEVAAYLRDKQTLLILDNFEHLVDGVDWLLTLLTTAPQLRLVITSRHRLPIQAQLVYEVAGLSVPPVPTAVGSPALTAPTCFTHYASVQLFIERAAAAHKLCRSMDKAELQGEDRASAQKILRILAQDAAELVRRAMAVTLKSSDLIPRDLARKLAADVDSVALPVIGFSPAFSDEDLIEIVWAGVPLRQVAVAGRPGEPL